VRQPEGVAPLRFGLAIRAAHMKESPCCIFFGTLRFGLKHPAGNARLAGLLGNFDPYTQWLGAMSETAKHRPLICLLVRLLGVYFIVEGVAGLLGNGIDCWMQWRYASEWGTPFQGGYVLGWTIAAVLYLGAGLIFIFKNRIVVDAIFHEDIGGSSGDRGT